MNDEELLVRIKVRASHPEFLHGLDIWLNLGLINDEQILRVCKVYLICPLPVSAIVRNDFAPEEILPKVENLPRPRSSVLFQVWQAFRDELSVRWLLFLGIFLVILSSGVLAATQWDKFPSFGQYAVLWTYTLVFWGVSYWTNKQENLQLTSQTLETIALLLIPVNFWAIDSFNLWQNFWGWITIALASISLVSISFLEIKTRFSSYYSHLAFLCLCFLHWGWHFLSFSLIAVYLGVTLVTLSILARSPGRFLLPQTSSNEAQIIQPKIGNIYVIFALTVLLVRAIFVAGIPIEQLGLAIGICGWVLGGVRSRGTGSRGAEEQGSGGEFRSIISSAPQLGEAFSTQVLERIGAVLLFLGWYVSLEPNFIARSTSIAGYIQAIAVSGFALHFYWQKLCRDWLRRDLLAIFVIGVQAHFLMPKLIPDWFRQNAIDLCVEITRAQDYPYTVYSVTLVPYLILVVWLTGWLYRREKPQLAAFGEWLALGLGIILTLVSLNNPTWRSLNLFLSTLILAYVTVRRLPLRIPLIYLTHIFGVLTICATVDWWFPNLSESIWASILIVMAIAQWSSANFIKTTNHFKTFWYRSGWHLGFVLTGLSYSLFAARVPDRIGYWSLFWLLIPLTLTAIASRISGKRRIYASVYSFAALAFVQFLTLWQEETRLIALGTAVVLMALNTNYWREKAMAIMHLGFLLSFAIALFWEQLSLPGWFLFGAIATVIFWVMRGWFAGRSNSLASLYAEASDKWGITLCAIELAFLTIHYLISL
jgi:hypothetical protein